MVVVASPYPHPPGMLRGLVGWEPCGMIPGGRIRGPDLLSQAHPWLSSDERGVGKQGTEVAKSVLSST
jgi:hypothetical protein